MCDLISVETNTANVTPETKLEDLGVDSLEFVSLMLAIGGQFKEIPDSRWSELDTVGDIIRIIAE